MLVDAANTAEAIVVTDSDSGTDSDEERSAEPPNDMQVDADCSSDDDAETLDVLMGEERARQEDAEAARAESGSVCGPKCTCAGCAGLLLGRQQAATRDTDAEVADGDGWDNDGCDLDDGSGWGEAAVLAAMVRMTEEAARIEWEVDDERATDQAEAFLRAHMWGHMQLCLATLEYADDQKQDVAMETIPGCPCERRLEERVLARMAKRRLEKFAIGAYDEAGLVIELKMCSVQWGQEPAALRAPITDEEINKLNLQFTCSGCGRAEACPLSKRGHEQHCQYVRRIQTWENPDAEDGYWAVDALIDVQGPPENRFWKLIWADGRTDSDGRRDDGSFRSDWQPAANVVRCGQLQKDFWRAHPRLWECANQSIEGFAEDGSHEFRCTHCNRMGFDTELGYQGHVRQCPFRPKARSLQSKVGGMVQDARQQAAQAAWPGVTVHTAEGTKKLEALLSTS